MQQTLTSRYGIKSYGVPGVDYCFVNGDPTDFRRENPNEMIKDDDFKSVVNTIGKENIKNSSVASLKKTAGATKIEMCIRDRLYKCMSAVFFARYIEKHREYYRFRYQDKVYTLSLIHI